MAFEPIRVLLVEDNPGDARLIYWMLREAGEGRFEFAEVERLSAALRRLDEESFCVVLLDLSLPDSQGMETFRAVYSAHPETPIVVLTGLADEDTAVRTVEEGAQDYLVKAQVQNGRLAHALRYAVGRRRRQRCLEKARGSTEEDLKLARRVLDHLLPKGPPACAGVDLHGASFPAVTTSGDYFDYLPLGDGRVGMVIADVMGHGLGPALLMMATRAYLRAFAQVNPDIDRVLTLTNRALAGDVADDRFVTLLLAQFDAGRGVLRYTNAGHNAGYVLDPSGAARALLYSTGLPLGIHPDGGFPVAPEIELAPGETVVLWTDGVVQAHAPTGEPFGEDRALNVVRSLPGRPAREVVAALCEEARSFAGGGPQEDDMTAIVLKTAPAS